MQLINQKILGIIVLLLLTALVLVKRLATGSIFDKPQGSPLVKLINSFNLCFLLAVNPLVAVLLIAQREGIMDSTHLPVDAPWLSMTVEIFGFAIYVMGYALMAWALIRLGKNYQLGGTAPRVTDRLVVNGPFRWIRHPMYTAALCISLGLTGLLPSWVILCVFGIYLVLILLLIPIEEDNLGKAYGDAYSAYQKKTRRLVPFVY